MKIYLDHAATTPVDKEVLLAMQPYFSKKFGNSSTIYRLGQEADSILKKSRQIIAKFINANPEEIIFTSGGSESNNFAIKGVLSSNKNHIITTNIEHPSVLNTCKALEKKGYQVTYLKVDKEGLINLKDLEDSITKNTALVSIMHANNEVGAIQPIKEIGKICKSENIIFHVDAVQSLGKIPIDTKEMNIDLLSASAHKIYGPKGVGILYVNKNIKLEPLIHGGEQEFGLRSGTENIPGIVGFAKAVELRAKNMNKESKNLLKLRDYLIKGVLKIKDSKLNGSLKNRLSNNTNFSFKSIEGESLVLRLDSYGIMASTGSACSTKSLKPSHVLLAMGLSPEQAHGSLRLTLGKNTNKKEIDYVLKVLPRIVKDLRSISSLK